MCTRYFLSKSNPELKSIIEDVIASPLSRRFINIGKTIKIEGEIRPTDVVPVLAPNPRGEKKVFPMKWGYKSIHKDGKLLLNARSETASEKPTFKYDWLNDCLTLLKYIINTPNWLHCNNILKILLNMNNPFSGSVS